MPAPIEDAWERFLGVLWLWLTGNSFLPSGITAGVATASKIEDALVRLGATPYDALIPWLWREWRATHRFSARGRAVAQRMFSGTNRIHDIKDWYLGAHPNIMGFSFEEAYAAALTWHDQLRAQAALAALGTAEMEQAFGEVLWSWPDGATLRRFVRWRQEAGGGVRENRNAFQAVGAALGHCYQNVDVAAQYADSNEMLVLFDMELKPRVVIAAPRDKLFDAGMAWDDAFWHADEIRGAGNVFPVAKWWSKLEDILGLPKGQLPEPPDGWTMVRRGTSWVFLPLGVRLQGTAEAVKPEAWASGIYAPRLHQRISQKLH